MILEVKKGEHIAGVAERLVAAAKKFGSTVEATFNGVRLVATPDSSADDLCRYYADECRRGAATMNNDDKMDLIDEGIRNAATRLRVVAEQGRSGQFSCPEMEFAASAILALRAERDRLRADVERHESYGGELEGRLAEQAEQAEEVIRLTRERDAWSDEAVKMLRQRNVLLEWARERAGFACGHDVMVAAGLAAAPAGEGGAP